MDKSYISKEQLILLELTGFDWSDILKKYLIDNETINYYKDDMDWSILYHYQKCPVEIIEKYKSRYGVIAWMSISGFQNLTEDFIDRFANVVDLKTVCKYQHIPLDEAKILSK